MGLPSDWSDPASILGPKHHRCVLRVNGQFAVPGFGQVEVPALLGVSGSARGGSGPVLGLSHAVGFTVGDDDGGVVQEPVEHADGGGVLGQEPSPLNWKWHTFVWG